MGSLSAVVIAILFVLSPMRAGSAIAQENNAAAVTTSPEIEALAARIAEKLSKTGQKTVAVSSFSLQKGSPQGFGLQLARQVRSALAKNGAIQVFDNERLIGALQEKKWMAIDIYDPLVFRSIANVMGVPAAIEGHYKVAGEFVELSIVVMNTADDKKIAEFKTKLPVSGMTPTSDTVVQDPRTKAFLAVGGGMTAPGCKYCPQPEFSPEARAKKVSKAIAILRVTVRADGRPTDIRLVRPAGYGLDENAAEAVQGWEFVPGHLPDGTAVSTRVDIEVTFALR